MAHGRLTDPLADALCRRMDDRRWLEPGRGRASDPVVRLCLACPALAACIDHTVAEVERGLIPSGVVQAGVAWPSPQTQRAKALARLRR